MLEHQFPLAGGLFLMSDCIKCLINFNVSENPTTSVAPLDPWWGPPSLRTTALAYR